MAGIGQYALASEGFHHQLATELDFRDQGQPQAGLGEQASVTRSGFWNARRNSISTASISSAGEVDGGGVPSSSCGVEAT